MDDRCNPILANFLDFYILKMVIRGAKEITWCPISEFYWVPLAIQSLAQRWSQSAGCVTSW